MKKSELTEPQKLSVELQKFFQVNTKRQRAKKRFDDKPQDYKEHIRMLRFLVPTFGIWFGSGMLIPQLVPGGSSSALWSIPYAIVFTSAVAAGYKFANLDVSRLDKKNKLNKRTASALADVTQSFERNTAQDFFEAITTLTEGELGKVKLGGELSERQKRKVQTTFGNIDEAVAQFSLGSHIGKIDAETLEEFRRKILGLAEKVISHGVEISESAKRLDQSLHRINSRYIDDQMQGLDGGDSPEIHGLEGTPSLIATARPSRPAGANSARNSSLGIGGPDQQPDPGQSRGLERGLGSN